MTWLQKRREVTALFARIIFESRLSDQTIFSTKLRSRAKAYMDMYAQRSTLLNTHDA